MRSASCVAAAIALAIAACGPTAPGNGDRDGGGGDDDRDGGSDEGADATRADARPRYDAPPGRLEDDPVYRDHARDFEEYHTCYVSPEGLRDSLRATIEGRR